MNHQRLEDRDTGFSLGSYRNKYCTCNIIQNNIFKIRNIYLYKRRYHLNSTYMKVGVIENHFF